MVMMYTCAVCETRSARVISKASYNNGVVLVRCPGCSSLHLVADRLGFFDESGDVDVESLLAARGEVVQRHVLPSPSLRLSGGGGEPSLTGTGAAPVEADEFVYEFNDSDLATLRSASKSYNLKSGEAVMEGEGGTSAPPLAPPSAEDPTYKLQ